MGMDAAMEECRDGGRDVTQGWRDGGMQGQKEGCWDVGMQEWREEGKDTGTQGGIQGGRDGLMEAWQH